MGGAVDLSSGSVRAPWILKESIRISTCQSHGGGDGMRGGGGRVGGWEVAVVVYFHTSFADEKVKFLRSQVIHTRPQNQ